MIKEIMIYVTLGIIGDILITLYYLFVGRLQAFPASFLAIFITLLNFFIIEKVVVSTNWVLMIFYAIGSAIGCFSIIVFQKKRMEKKLEKQKKNSKKKR